MRANYYEGSLVSEGGVNGDQEERSRLHLILEQINRARARNVAAHIHNHTRICSGRLAIGEEVSSELGCGV